jgi:signal transduction histidine kinase
MNRSAQILIASIMKDRKEFSSYMLAGLVSRIQTRLKKTQATLAKFADIESQLLSESEELSKLIGDLDHIIRDSDLNKIVSRRHEALDDHRAWISLQQIVNEVVHHFSVQAPGKRIEVTVEIPESILVHGYRDSLFQLMFELILNSIKSLTAAHPENPVILIHALIEKGDVNLVVSDNGLGMNEESQKCASNSLSGEFHNDRQCGVGLLVCHSHLKRLGFEVNFSSQVKHGASFQIIIPKVYVSSGESK